MLVLSRKEGQSIHIGNDIVIQISRIQGNRVRVAIDAPLEVSIRRGELVGKLEAAKTTRATDPTPVQRHCG
ncbi:carbon storage regulator [Aporhodopirellula aestuarii]|uniref:Translational regulator CsrA n=1 Tax=Aporhodopirellula aestuarii TaxID=2950107 RepID=A0ABT0U2J0_9BACT|nr:carbon storage regulator [Aporhodopirellula aestuarii]MCM2370869.1 carbon storage regulator [Aporhodopirellula aestuarii]